MASPPVVAPHRAPDAMTGKPALRKEIQPFDDALVLLATELTLVS